MPDTRLFPIVEGWTEEIGPFTLRIDGAAADLTGKDIEVVLRDKTDALVTFAGDVRVDNDPTTGQVYLTPMADDFLNAKTPYRIHFKGTDGAGKVVFFPDDAAYRIDVFKP